MRDQYAGDVSDVIKFAFLRAPAGSDRKLGVAWYYVAENDGGPDGRHLEWREEEAWRMLDADLHAGLAALPERTIAALEGANFWPNGTQFHGEPMPSKLGRIDWALRKQAALAMADLVLLDPDNGTGKSTPKHATFEEIRQLRKPNWTVVFISFTGRNKTHKVLLNELH